MDKNRTISVLKRESDKECWYNLLVDERPMQGAYLTSIIDLKISLLLTLISYMHEKEYDHVMLIEDILWDENGSFR